MMIWSKRIRTYWRLNFKPWVFLSTHTSLRFLNVEMNNTLKPVENNQRMLTTLPWNTQVEESCLISFRIQVDLKNQSLDTTLSNSWKVCIIAITNKFVIGIWNLRIFCLMESSISRSLTLALLLQQWEEMVQVILKLSSELLIIWLLKFT